MSVKAAPECKRKTRCEHERCLSEYPGVATQTTRQRPKHELLCQSPSCGGVVWWARAQCQMTWSRVEVVGELTGTWAARGTAWEARVTDPGFWGVVMERRSRAWWARTPSTRELAGHGVGWSGRVIVARKATRSQWQDLWARCREGRPCHCVRLLGHSVNGAKRGSRFILFAPDDLTQQMRSKWPVANLSWHLALVSELVTGLAKRRAGIGKAVTGPGARWAMKGGVSLPMCRPRSSMRRDP